MSTSEWYLFWIYHEIRSAVIIVKNLYTCCKDKSCYSFVNWRDASEAKESTHRTTQFRLTLWPRLNVKLRYRWKQPVAVIESTPLLFPFFVDQEMYWCWGNKVSHSHSFISWVFLTILVINESRRWLFARSSSISARRFTPLTTCWMRSTWQKIK